MSAAWRAALIKVALLAAAILVLFFRDALDLMGQWQRSTFEHCWLILPVIGWLIWRRRAVLAGLTPQPSLPGLVFLALAALCWGIGEAAMVALLRHAALVLMLIALVPTLLGRQVTAALLFPLAYALFLIPMGEEFVPAMQIVTAKMAMGLLRLSGVPAFIDGIFITTPGGFFAVAEACSGVKFLVAMAALSVLAAHLLFKGSARRIGFVAFALIAAALANGVRAWGTIMMAETWGNRFAVGADHIIYGWVFFALVIAVVGWAASPWFDRDIDDDEVDAASIARWQRGWTTTPWVAAALTLALLVTPVGWMQFAAASPRTITPIAAPATAGWSAVESDSARAAWTPHFAGAGRIDCHHQQEAAGPQAIVTLCIAGFARQGEGREIIGFGQGAVGPDSDWRWAQSLAPIGAAATQRIANGQVQRDVATLYVIDRTVTASARVVKWHTLLTRLTNGDQRVWAMLVSADVAQGGRAAVERYVAANGGAEALARRLTIGVAEARDGTAAAAKDGN